MIRYAILTNMTTLELSDTDAASMAQRDEMLRQQSPSEKLRLMSQLCALGRSLVLGQLKNEHPNCSDDELLYWLAERTLGPELADKYFTVPDRPSGA